MIRKKGSNLNSYNFSSEIPDAFACSGRKIIRIKV